jgi:hypothetical protein
LDCIRAQLNKYAPSFRVSGLISGESREIYVYSVPEGRADEGEKVLGVRFVHPESPQITYFPENPNHGTMLFVAETLGRMGYGARSWKQFAGVMERDAAEKMVLEAAAKGTKRREGASSVV